MTSDRALITFAASLASSSSLGGGEDVVIIWCVSAPPVQL